MTLKAIIPSGQTELTVNGLHQWDYGQKLEIHSPDLPAVVEVHFACAGMTEAVVRVCEAADGVAVAVIPDHCLEQTTPITAWVYEVESGTSGYTSKTIILPIIPRTRPQVCATVPTTISDKYTESIAAINGIVSSLTEGKVEANHAKTAGSADTINKYMHYIHLTGATTFDIGSAAPITMDVSATLQLITTSASITPGELYNVLNSDFKGTRLQCTGLVKQDIFPPEWFEFVISCIFVDQALGEIEGLSGDKFIFDTIGPEGYSGPKALRVSDATITDTVIKL